MSDIYRKIKEGRGVPRRIDGADWFGLELPSVEPNVPKRPKTLKQQRQRKPLRKQDKGWWARVDLNLDPLVPNHRSTNSEGFIWCRLGVSEPTFLSLSCTEVVPRNPISNDGNQYDKHLEK